MMKISIGPPVEGKDFFGRQKELDRIAGIMAKKQGNVFLPGPRRIGKSSIFIEFIRRHKRKYNFIYFDLESRHSIIELCQDLQKEIEKQYPDIKKSSEHLKKTWNTLSDMFKKIKIGDVVDIQLGRFDTTKKELMDRMEEIFEELTKQKFIFAFDEFSDFLFKLKGEGIEEVRIFLEWLRRLRQEGKIQVMITGSINIISTVEELNVPDLINDLTDVKILPLNTDEVRQLLQQLLADKQIELSADVLDFASKKLQDGIPFYIQLFADSVQYLIDGPQIIDKINDIEKLYAEIIHESHKEFIDLYTRLRDYLDNVTLKAAYKILAHLSSHPLSFDDLFPYVEADLKERSALNKLLKRLEDECYIYMENGMYHFLSPMLSDWWANRYSWEKT